MPPDSLIMPPPPPPLPRNKQASSPATENSCNIPIVSPVRASLFEPRIATVLKKTQQRARKEQQLGSRTPTGFAKGQTSRGQQLSVVQPQRDRQGQISQAAWAERVEAEHVDADGGLVYTLKWAGNTCRSHVAAEDFSGNRGLQTLLLSCSSATLMWTGTRTRKGTRGPRKFPAGKGAAEARGQEAAKKNSPKLTRKSICPASIYR